MNLLYDLIHFDYLGNAFWAALLSGVACGLVGTYIVCRRLVFLAGGITHASFGGLGVAFYLGTNPIVGAMLAALAAAFGIEYASSHNRIREDSAIGIIWSVGMAIGALFMSLRPGYTSGDLTAYLFGSIITVTRGDLIALAILALLLVVGAICWLRPLMYIAFDRDFARSRNLPTRLVSYLMAAVMALTIVFSIRIMGIVLLLSLVTLPVVVVNSCTKSYIRIAIAAPIVAVIGNLIGLTISYQWDVPPGAAIIFTLTVSLIGVKLLTLCRKSNPRSLDENPA